MKCSRLAPKAREELLTRIQQKAKTIGPVEGADDVCRLAPIGSWNDLSRHLPLIPCKKYVLPPRDLLWSLAADKTPSSNFSSEPIFLIGLYLCDLYALDYLDRVFAGDRAYEQRRRRLRVVGRVCESHSDCFCPQQSAPPFFDLFFSADVLWSGSPAGDSLLQNLAGLMGEQVAEKPFPKELLAGTGGPVVADLKRRMDNLSAGSFWAEEAKRCLSCGSCSAVCPTCYCYDMVDEVTGDGDVERLRVWDNCFFASHAEVAGGHNFRPGRGDRLRFRFEHKFLGFGDLRGVSSCVGCGRCARACPVGIDMKGVLQRVQEDVEAGDDS